VVTLQSKWSVWQSRWNVNIDFSFEILKLFLNKFFDLNWDLY